MHIDMDSYERTLREQWQQNEEDLAAFASSLEADGLSERTIRHHLRNVGCFLNEYLLHEDDNSAEMGCYLVDDYMETYVIQQCSWATPRAIEHNGASLVRFYRFMCDARHVDEDAFEELRATIDAQLPAWKDECRKAVGDSRGGAGVDEGSSLLASIHETVARTMGVPEVAQEDGNADASPTREEAIDALTLALLRLVSAEDMTDGRTGEGALRAACERLCVRGLARDDADGLATLTPDGIASADATLARLGYGRLM